MDKPTINQLPETHGLDPAYEDPIVAEVRRVREQIAAECDYDFDRIAEYCRRESQKVQEQMTRERSESHAEL